MNIPSDILRHAFSTRYTANKCIIWVNPGEKDIPGVTEIKDKHHRRMHIFIADANAAMSNSFKRFLEAFFYDPFDTPKVIIHIHKEMPDLRIVLEKAIIANMDVPVGATEHIKIVAEREGAWFRLDRSRPWRYISFSWENSHDLDVSVHMSTHGLTGYGHPGRTLGGTPGAVKNQVQAKYPQLFKQQIIEEWKRVCPPGIQKSFKNDDDIWEYILQEGEWKEDPSKCHI